MDIFPNMTIKAMLDIHRWEFGHQRLLSQARLANSNYKNHKTGVGIEKGKDKTRIT